MIPRELERKAPFVPWPVFYTDRRVFNFQQGEHVTCLGPTGCGKTTLLLEILKKRRYQLVFATKPRDPLITSLKRDGYYVTREPVLQADLHERIVLWPRIESPSDVPHQRQVFGRALSTVYRDGNWATCLDEVRYQTQYLGLGNLVDLLWQQGRSLKASLLVGAQRPAWIPVSAYDQASHLFIWSFRGGYDLKKLGELGTVDPKEVVSIIRTLPRHEALYIDAINGRMIRTKVEV